MSISPYWYEDKSIGPTGLDRDRETNFPLCVITYTVDGIFQSIAVYALKGLSWLHNKSYFYLEVGVSYMYISN